MHDLAFADAARPTRVVCLRLPLLPYSIGHEIILWQQRNPLLLASREEFDAMPMDQQMTALVRAVLTCHRNWAGNHKTDWTIPLWGLMIRKTNWPLAIADFRNYLEAGRFTLPTISQSDPEFEIANGTDQAVSGRALGAPFLSQLLLFAVKALQAPLPKAYDMQFSVVAGLYYTSLEFDGRVNITNQKEIEIRKEMKEHREEALKEELEAKQNG